MLAAVSVLFERQRNGLTPRAADTASPWARRGGWSGENSSLAVLVGRHRRAADAIVRQCLEV